MLSLTPGLLALLAPLVARQSPAEDAPELFSRVAVLGASVSSGYGLAAELQADVDFGTILECALRAEPDSVVVEADSLFFTDPHSFGRRFLSKVEESHPSLVIALDYLFWFPFGPEPTEEARLAEFELGLKLLGELDCMLVIGDIPDISEALEGIGPFGLPLVTPELLAEPETIVKLNARLQQWAEERGHVVIAPMGEFLARLRKGEPVSVRSNRWPDHSLRTILQADLLHPTTQGSIALALLALDSLAAGSATSLGDAIDWDEPSVQARLMQRTEVERAKRQELQRQREERRKARKEHEKDGGGRRSVVSVGSRTYGVAPFPPDLYRGLEAQGEADQIGRKWCDSVRPTDRLHASA